MWRSPVARTVRDGEAGGSNPLTPTFLLFPFYLNPIQRPVSMISLILPHSIYQWQIVGYFLASLIASLVGAEIISKKLNLPQEFSRKFIHIVVGFLVIAFSINIREMQPITFVSLLFTLINAIVLKFNLMPAMGSDRKSYGTVFYPFTILVGAIFLWDQQKIIFLSLVLVLALADAIAAMVGQKWKKSTTLIILKDKKTIPGSLAMWISTSLIIYILLVWNGVETDYPPVIIAVISGLFISIAEMISVNGSDNISIGIATALILTVFLDRSIMLQQQFLWAMLFGSVLCLLSYKVHFLELGGALVTFVLAVVIFGVGGWQWTLPILTFFISASLLSKAGKQKKKKYDLMFEKNSKRDGFQVLANGGIALILAAYYFFEPTEILYFLYVVTLAAANADTWATELGVFSRSIPRLITNFQPVVKGRSGAISVMGTMGSYLGGAVVALSAFVLFWSELNFIQFFALSMSGLLASLTDSFLGASVQAQYKDTDSGEWTERVMSNSGKENVLIQGRPWLNNDGVNFIAILSAPFYYLIISTFIKI